ncbi:MAG: hypothetical protein ACTH3E_03515, partial [Psychroflexus halocasei]
ILNLILSLKKQNPNSQFNPIIYVTEEEHDVSSVSMPLFTEDSTDIVDFYEDQNYATLPIFFEESRTIKLPKGVKRHVNRLPKKVTKPIDADDELAKEKCLILASLLTYTVFNQEGRYWKSLSSTIMDSQFKKGADNTRIYSKVISALKYSTDKTYPVIECFKNEDNRESYQEGNYSKKYKFHDSKLNNNIETYELKFDENIKKLRKRYLKKLNKANDNKIVKNLIKVYEFIELPSLKELDIYSKGLVKQKHKTKKGKLLTRLNNKPKSYYSYKKNRSFVEDNIKLFKCLTDSGFLIPNIGDYKSGGRVVDSFNLMPSWIRSLIKIEDEPIVELDFKALHPNIASSIYGDVNYQITHESLEKALELPLKEVKIEHLSFFNKRIDDMKKSPLFDYYYKSEKEMLKNLMNEKIKYKSHKITSQKLFKKEVSIMSSIIKKLNDLEIYVIYVYDALYCKRSDRKIVKKIMNRVIQNHGVNTCVG